jgi:hypothetical protein
MSSTDQGGNSRHPFLSRLALSRRLFDLFPLRVRRFAKRFVQYEAYTAEAFAAKDPNANAEEVSTYPAKVDVRLGILKEPRHCHSPYISACRGLGVPYRLVDIMGADWIEVVRGCGCDAFLVWPPFYTTVLKKLYDDRLRILTRDLGKVIYPTYDELWFYESKHRALYWLEAHGLPHPRTWVFYSQDEALDFAREADLPLVFKTDLGATSGGVRIFRERGRLQRFIKHVFLRGAGRDRSDPRDRQWGAVYLQEYLPDVKEWRVMRNGGSYWAHQKGRIGQFHSGSNIVLFFNPPRRLLDLVRTAADTGSFTSMCFDVFETTDGRFLINEFHTVFGPDPIQMKVDGKEGRYCYNAEADRWDFEEGHFTDNAHCDLRVEYLLKLVGKPLKGHLA